VAAIEAGMDRFAVLVFHDQHSDDDTQLAFSRNFGELEISSGGEMSRPEDRRLKLEMADISNLDRDNRMRAADDRVRLNALGNRLWHSDASFRAIPAQVRPVRHSLVRTHPVTGRKSLYLSAHIGTIVGWPMPEARAFIRDLTEHATQPCSVHAHRWRVNDLVMWDNRTTMHRARRYRDLQEVRDLRRTSVKGTGLTAEQVPAIAAE
jgi:alpha-ketoglutarate-dependent taurine dioxygenase